MFPEQSSALARVLETLPPLPDSILSHQIIVYATELRYFIIPIMLMVSLLGIETLIIAYLIVSKMNSREHTFRMSQKTMAMQKKILMALLIQASTMTINFLIPITYICSTIIFNYHNQAANNICFLVFSLHGLTSTSIMLWSHKPYRAVCSSFLGFRKSEVNSSKGIQVVATIMLNRSHVGRTSFLAS